MLVSGGGDGSSYAFRSPAGKTDLTGIIPVIKDIEVIDTTGAGDAFLAGELSASLLYRYVPHVFSVKRYSSMHTCNQVVFTILALT